MLNISQNIFKRAHSAAWIAPDGEFIPLASNQQHTDLAAEFPGMPTALDAAAGNSNVSVEDAANAERYPSTYAVARLRYVKVSTPFQCAWDGRGTRGDARMETMSDFMAQAVVWLKGSRHNSWGVDPHSDLIETKVYVTTVTDPDIYKRSGREDLSVGDFVDRYGSRETIDFLFGNLLDESFVRACRRIEERVLRSRKRLGESRDRLRDDELYRLIVRELRSSIKS